MTTPATIRRADIARISNLIEAAQSRGLEVAKVVYTAPDGGKVELMTKQDAPEGWDGVDLKVE